MMGPAKLGEIRAEVRKSFKRTDAQLLAWFNRQMETLARKPKASQVEIDTLGLLKDALAKEAARKPSRRKGAPVSGRSKR